MRTEPADLDRTDLAAALADGWGLACAELEHTPGAAAAITGAAGPG